MKQIILEVPNNKYEPRGIYCVKDTALTVFSSLKHPLETFKYLLPSFFAIMWLGLCGYWNSVFQVLIEEKVQKYNALHPEIPKNIVLPDFFFSILPYYEKTSICDGYITVFMFFTLFRFFLTPFREQCFRRAMFLQGCIFLIRSFSIYLTIMPNPTRDKTNITSNPFIEAFYIMFGIHKSVNDCLFSGHTANITTCFFFWYHYSHVVPIFKLDCIKLPIGGVDGYPLRFTVTKFFALLVLFGGILLFTITHLHYFVDIYIGFIVSFLLFKLYHNYILTIYTRENAWNYFLRWFEQNAKDIPRVIN